MITALPLKLGAPSPRLWAGDGWRAGGWVGQGWTERDARVWGVGRHDRAGALRESCWSVIPAGPCSLPGAAHPQPDLLSGIFRERLPWMQGWYWVIRYEASLIQRRLLKSLTWRVTQGPQPQ